MVMEKGLNLTVMMATIEMAMDAHQIVESKLDGLVQAGQAQNQVYALRELLIELTCN